MDSTPSTPHHKLANRQAVHLQLPNPHPAEFCVSHSQPPDGQSANRQGPNSQCANREGSQRERTRGYRARGYCARGDAFVNNYLGFQYFHFSTLSRPVSQALLHSAGIPRNPDSA